jgi:hypothetical protein
MRPKSIGQVGVERHLDGHGRIILTGSNEFEYAFQGDTVSATGASTSIFTNAVVHGLRTGEADRGHDQRISVDELYRYAFDKMRAVAPAQTPSKWSLDVEGDWTSLEACLMWDMGVLVPRVVSAAGDEQ